MDKNSFLFDGTATQGLPGQQLFHGGAEYAKFILRAAHTSGRHFDVVLARNLYTDPALEPLLAQMGDAVCYVDNWKEIADLVRRRGYRTFYSALPYEYPGHFDGPAEFVGVIHGLRRVELNWDSERFRYYHNPVKRAMAWCLGKSPLLIERRRRKCLESVRRLLEIPRSRFVTVSNHSKYSLLSFFPNLGPKDIDVFYSPFSTEGCTPDEPKEDYFLMVSANRFEKNIYRATLAFDRLFSQGRLADRRVVITGVTDDSMFAHLRNRSRFTLLPYVSVEEIRCLYRRAFAFVYPSLNEGFGYPPLQAMACGVPVAASSATSIPEAVGDAAIIFDPRSEDDLANRLLRLDLDADLRADLRKRGLRRVAELQALQSEALTRHLAWLFRD